MDYNLFEWGSNIVYNSPYVRTSEDQNVCTPVHDLSSQAETSEKKDCVEMLIFMLV